MRDTLRAGAYELLASYLYVGLSEPQQRMFKVPAGSPNSRARNGVSGFRCQTVAGLLVLDKRSSDKRPAPFQGRIGDQGAAESAGGHGPGCGNLGECFAFSESGQGLRDAPIALRWPQPAPDPRVVVPLHCRAALRAIAVAGFRV